MTSKNPGGQNDQHQILNMHITHNLEKSKVPMNQRIKTEEAFDQNPDPYFIRFIRKG